MDALVILVVGLLILFLGYRFFLGFLQRKVFAPIKGTIPPAILFQDGVDFIPTQPLILFGHHFMSVAGIPIVLGCGIALIWGLLPALLWILLGSIFLGMTHDFGSLMISFHHQGQSMGELSGRIIGHRGRTLILLLSLFLLWLVLSLSVSLTSSLFILYPQVILPFWLAIPLALSLGYYLYRRKIPLFFPTAIALLLGYGFLYIGVYIPVESPSFFLSPLLSWALILLIYAYVSSILPLWSFLQPRDFLHFWQVVVGFLLAFLGIIFLRPRILVPIYNQASMDYFGLFPFLFILLSSGVISGCNSLVSSGTTVKQLDQECKAPLIGGGAKLLQGSLALFVLIILAVGFSPLEERGFFYLDSLEGSSLLRILSAFVEGMATFIGALGIPPEYGLALGAMVALSFTVSTLDTTTRILRYLLCEMASPYGFQPLTNRYGATFLALLPAFSLILLMEGDGFFSLFFLFGSTNQILAGLVFFIGSLYLSYQCKPLRYTLVPMFFLFIIAGFSLLMNINIWVAKGDLFLTIAGGILFLLEIWLILEAISVFRRLSLEEMLPFNF